MNDLRNEIRSALTEMVDEAPPPPPFEDIGATRSPALNTWAGPRLAVAVFAVVIVVIGAVALIRPFDGTPPSPLADIPGLDADVDGPSLDGAFAVPSYLPDGFEPIGAERNWMATGVALRFADEDGAELSVGGGDDLRGIEVNLDPAVVGERLARAYPELSIAETTVRGLPAFVVEGGDVWNAAVVVIEGPASISRVLGFDVSASEVLAVARGLEPATVDQYERWAAQAVDFHLDVGAWVPDPDAFSESVGSIDGVIDIQRLRDDRVSSDPGLVILEDDAEQAPTTTNVRDTDDTVVAPQESELVRLAVTLDDPARAEDAAGAITDLGSAQVTFTAAVAEMLAETYFTQVTAGATVVHDEPTILQPAPGPEPVFDLSDLGAEAPLHPATATIPSTEVAEVDTSFRFPVSERTPLRGPILHIGSLDDGTRLVLTFDGGPDYVERTLHDGGWSGGGGSLRTYGYGVAGHGGSSDGPTYVRLRVPLDTAVVALVFDDGTALWQRPIAGHGLIPVEGLGSASELHATVTAFAADGTVIGEWRQPGNG